MSLSHCDPSKTVFERWELGTETILNKTCQTIVYAVPNRDAGALLHSKQRGQHFNARPSECGREHKNRSIRCLLLFHATNEEIDLMA